MEIQNNDDFKYVIQDTGCVYFGRELTYDEVMNRNDVPFKFKAVINAHIARDTSLDSRMTDHILKMTEEAFSFRIYEQLRLTIRICYKEQKRCINGKTRDKWVHKSCLLRQFCGEYRDKVNGGSVMIEEISISKLALMAFSV
ncbi:MAG: hypothetical protein K2N73_00860 [Lachnospiraceae bacterium]|nr:hypothetical protein [Lachnospiraceae bacterium]